MIRSAAVAALALALATAVTAAAVGISPATAADHPNHISPHGHRTVTCLGNGHLLAYTHNHGQYQVRNSFWLGQRPQCLANTTGRTNFKVIQRAGFNAQGHVVAFPDILRGCIWSICSPKAQLPRQVSTVGSPVSTWHTTEHAPGTWNAAYDIWYSKKRMITGQADGAELMIWINTHGGCCALQPGAPTVVIDGQKWLFSHWRTGHLGATWNYIQFRRVSKTWKVNHFRLKPFMRRIERMGLIKPTWWLDNIEAGFEIWNGGQGLGTTRFSVQHIAPARHRGRNATAQPLNS
jgi:Glycosyl hydrolase family 12